MDQKTKPYIVGINHVALEVGDIEEALAFYARIFTFELRGRGQRAAFIDMGDQFIALSEGRSQNADHDRHFGLVVDDRSRVRELAEAAGAKILEGATLDFLDPWGNRIQVVEYRDLQFTKTSAVLKFMGLDLDKSEEAQAELCKKGIEPATGGDSAEVRKPR
ncbi:MAG: VOC family protein [Nitrosospira sp.]|nr:VOC family protein [Nitrosospira sp.]MDN5881649.1 VOC family protein [Nitrosospira sp.]MDN5936007.1 VOC family protein [Nitrosospira sp.]